jgi:hypothetical protein
MHFLQRNALARGRPWAWLILVFVMSLPAVTVRFYAADEIEYFAYLRSVWFDRDISFDNEYRYFYEHGVAQGRRARPGGGYYGDRFYATFLGGTTPTGLRINFAPVGTAILWAPFYVVTDAGVRIARALGSDVPADGFSRPYIAAVAYASAVYGFLALLLSGQIAHRLTGAGIWPVLAVWLGTPLLFYMYIAPGFSHAASAFIVAAFVAVWLYVRGSWSMGGVVALGGLAALMGMVREQDLFIALGPAIDYAVALVRAARVNTAAARTMFARAAAGTATFAICFLPQLAAYQTLFGRLGPSPQIERKMNWMSPNAWLVLTSPENGWLFWTPLMVPALAGLAWLATRKDERGWIGVICLLMVATQIYVAGSLDTWAGAGSFGQRRLVGLTVFLIVGLATTFVSINSRIPKMALQVFVVLAVWWNVGLIAQFGSGLMNRQHLNMRHNTYHNFVTVPLSVPNLAYRYITDRQSFYENRSRSTR